MSVQVRSVHPTVFGKNLIAWWDASDTANQTLTSGKLSSWTDRIGGVAATQATAALRPTVAASEVRFAGNNINLGLPLMPRSYTEHRWFLMLCRVKWSTVAPGDGTLFSINGFSGSKGMRQPFCGYTKAGAHIDVQWLNQDASGQNQYNQLSVVASGDDLWHSVVARRVGGVYSLSIDKGTEQSAGTNLALPLPVAGQTGLIGDYNNANLEWGLDTLILGQGDLTPDDVGRLHSYAMTRRNLG
jgi:hypothetical protein